MILYKAIKYIIFDQCIEKIFNQINKNLLRPSDRELGPSLELYEVGPGRHLRKIVIDAMTGGIYDNCTVYGLSFNLDTRRWHIAFTTEPDEQGKAATFDHDDLKANQIWLYE